MINQSIILLYLKKINFLYPQSKVSYMFLYPLASIIPPYATAGALIYVAILMLSGMEKLNWSSTAELLPALVIIVMIPLTFSIADGIALGFLTYVFLKFFNGEYKEISSGAWFLTMIFISKFIFL